MQRVSGRLRLAPAKLIDTNRLIKPAQLCVATVGEREPLTSNEFADNQRGEDFATFGLGRDPSRGNHRGTEEIVIFSNRFAGIDANANTDRLATGARLLECTLKGNRTLERTLGRGERSQESVTERLDFIPAITLECVAGDSFMVTKEFAANSVTEALHHRGMALDVGEEEGTE